MYKRFCALFIAVVLALPSFTMFGAGAELDVQRLRKLAKDNSNGLRNTIIDKIKKKIELQQAKEGIRDVRKAESTIRFSLLFNIKFPEKHGLPKEIELIMKIPEIESELQILDRQERFEILKAETGAELAFYDVLMSEYNLKYAESRLKDSKDTFKSIDAQYKTGKGKKEDADYLDNKIKGYEKDIQAGVLNLETKRKKLGDKIGLELITGYSVKEYLPQADIKREDLPEILDYSKKKDFELFKAVQARKIAEREVNELLGIYNSRYSEYIGNVKSYIANNRNGKMDYEKFIQIYNHALTRIDSPWAGAYKIWLLFFTISIPKEWFKGTYSGTRYFEDQKYALFVALVEQDKKRIEEQDAIKALEDKIYDTYNSLKVMERGYIETKENLAQAEKNYNRAYEENKLGLTSFTTLETARTALYEQQKSLYEMRIDYAKELSTFDLYTSGYIRNKSQQSGESGGEYEAGQSFTQSEIGGAQWFVRAYVTDYNFVFGVSIPDEYGITNYELYYDGKVVGKRMNIDETINHLPLVYADNSLMVVMLYKDKELKYIAYFDAGEYEGSLNLMPASDGTQNERLAGICSVSYVNELVSKFSVALNPSPEYDYDSYGLWYDNKEIIVSDKDASIETLNLYFANIELVTLSIYKNGKRMKTFSLRQEEVNEDVTVGRVVER